MPKKPKPGGPVPDPHKIFQTAESFREAADLLEKTPAQRGAAFLVTDALAVELYLKCLYVLDNEKRLAPPQEHPFDVLFRELTPGTQKAVIRRFGVNNNHPVLQLF